MCNVTSRWDEHPVWSGLPRLPAAGIIVPMQKTLALLALIVFCLSPSQGSRAEVAPAPNQVSGSELIDAVNAIRLQNGLAALQPHPILMRLAQQQADYELSIRTMTDSSADGLKPYQRALAAGYAVAGDVITNVGSYTELLYAGTNTSIDEAVTWWMNDPPHQNMILSSVFVDAGGGIASDGNTAYYVLVAGLSTGGTPIWTPPASYISPTPTIIPNTPNADGSIVHVAQSGDTLLAIAIAYHVSLVDLLALNGLGEKSTIYVGQNIIIRSAFTPTPTPPTSTPTSRPTSTLWPTSTGTYTATPEPPTPTRSSGLAVSAAGGAAGIIVLAALIVAGILAVAGKRRR